MVELIKSGCYRDPRAPLRRGAANRSWASRSKDPDAAASRRTDERARSWRTSRNRNCGKLESFSDVAFLIRPTPNSCFNWRQRECGEKFLANTVFATDLIS